MRHILHVAIQTLILIPNKKKRTREKGVKILSENKWNTWSSIPKPCGHKFIENKRSLLLSGGGIWLDKALLPVTESFDSIWRSTTSCQLVPNLDFFLQVYKAKPHCLYMHVNKC